MPRSNLNKTQKELYSMWDYFRKVCVRKGCAQYEGVPYDAGWLSFDGFVKENSFRYLRAKVKWKNYQRVALRKEGEAPAPLKLNNIRLKRKIMEVGFTKENTVFTSPSDMMKYVEFTHKYMFEGKLLGTRDIKNILKKRGINLSMGTITGRLNKGFNLFAENEHSKIKWKGKFRSYVEIAKIEEVSLAMLKKRNLEINNIRKSLDYCRQWDGYPTYEFEGKNIRKFEICDIISERLKIKDSTIKGRFVKYGMNLKFLTAPLGAKLTMRKNIFAMIDGIEFNFDSIEDAAQKLNFIAGNISQAVNGKTVHCGGVKFRFEGGQYNTSPILTMAEQMAGAREEMVQRSKKRHASETRYCQTCEQTKDKKHFNVRNFKRCKECMARENGIINIGQHEERMSMLKQGLIYCSDCKAYKEADMFNKNESYHHGRSTICRVHSKERARLNKYGTEELYQEQQTLNLLKEKIRESEGNRI